MRSKRLYHLALEYDSTLASAWTGLTNLYLDEHFGETYLSEDFLDSALILANIALSYDDQIPAAYIMRGVYSYFKTGGQIKEALNNYEKALRFNPNEWGTYHAIADLYIYKDYLTSIEYLQKSASLNPGLQLPGVLRDIGTRFFYVGCTDEAKQYIRQAFLLDDDTATYCLNLGSFEYFLGNYEKAIENGIKTLETDSSLLGGQILLAVSYRLLGQYEMSLRYFQKSRDRYSLDELGYYYRFDWAGHVYSVNGYREQADQYFNRQVDIANRAIELDRPRPTWNLIAAGIYAYRGDKNEAYRYLNMYNQKCDAVELVNLFFIKNDPLLDNIREEPEFQRLLKDFEAKYQAQHDKVRKWLDEQDGL